MFAKVFEQIFDSSIAEDWTVRHVFEDFLKLASKCRDKWIVDKTPESISRRTNTPIDIVKRAIQKLEGPDPNSRTPVREGRRIIRLDDNRDWGWEIVNYEKYRQIATAEMLRMSEADRKREYRKRMSRTCPGQQRDMSVSVSESICSFKEGIVKGGFKKPTIEELKLHCAKIGIPETEAQKFLDHYESNGWRVGKTPMKSWPHAMNTWRHNWQEFSFRNRPQPKQKAFVP